MKHSRADIDEQRLRKAHAFLAHLVANVSEAYLPVFERLDREVERLEQKRSAVEKAREIAAQASATR